MSRNELERLHYGPAPGDQPQGVGTVQFVIDCEQHADAILSRAKEVLDVVISNSSIDAWPADAEWRRLLPSWFVAKFEPERTPEEVERYKKWWDSLSFAEKRAESVKNDTWTLSGWIYWFQPSQRQWFWWDAFVEQMSRIRLFVEVIGWPFPWKNLEWLFLASGATHVESED